MSCYTIASLCIRPFSGYLLDTLARKPLYLVAYFIFITIFAGYMLAGVLSLFIMLRVVHGLAFGMVTVAGNTIVIDITPSSRRGEAVGYYGLMNNTAMSFGPMIGLSCMTYIPLKRFCLLAHIRNYRFCCRMPRQDPTQTTSQTRTYLIGPLCAAERYPGRNRTAIALHTIWHDKHLCSHVCQRNRNYLEFRIVFTFMAVGMAVSRMFSGKQVDKGRITQVITLGLYLVCSCFFILSACGLLMKTVPELTNILFLWLPSYWE